MVLVELILRWGIYLHSSHRLSAEGKVSISLNFGGAEQLPLPPRHQGYFRRKKKHLYNETNPKTANQISQNFVVWKLPAPL